MFRPAPAPHGAAADQAATVGHPIARAADRPAVDVSGGPAGADGGAQGTPAGGIGGGPAVQPPGGPTRPRGRLIALAAAIAVIVAGGAIYLAATGRPAASSAHHATTSKTSHQPAVRMLGPGQTASFTKIPWSLVGPGWTLAEVSSAPATPAAAAVGTGTTTTDLVDPQGGRYQIRASSSGATPLLLAWSGDGYDALYAVPTNSAGAGATYELLSLQTGTMTQLPLPAGVTAVGFSRPDGTNILAVKEAATVFRLQRYNLHGNFQATIGTLPRKAGSPDWLPGCGVQCGALSSPDGLTDVWGVAGDEMQLVGNAGAPAPIRRLAAPGSGSPPSCIPVTWWDTSTILSYCSVAGRPSVGRLWLVPADGSAPSTLTDASGTAAGSAVVTGAWQGPGAVYVTVTNAHGCRGGASGPGGLALDRVSGGSLRPVTVNGTTHHYTSVVSVYSGRLLLLAQTSCPGTASLLWFSPSTGATTTLLAGQPGQAGVLAAAPYGLGPTATYAG